MQPDYVVLLGVFKDHTMIVNTLWGILQAVALALLGFVFSQDYVRRSAWILLGLSVAFVVFAVGNRIAILRSQAVLRAVHGQFHDQAFLASAPLPMRGVLEAHSASEVDDIRQGHYVLTAGVVLSTWVPFIAGRRKSRVMPPNPEMDPTKRT